MIQQVRHWFWSLTHRSQELTLLRQDIKALREAFLTQQGLQMRDMRKTIQEEGTQMATGLTIVTAEILAIKAENTRTLTYLTQADATQQRIWEEVQRTNRLLTVPQKKKPGAGEPTRVG